MPEWLVPLFQVLLIDVVLAGDNAIVVGMAAAGLPRDQRRKAIFWGIIAATIMRISFAAVTTQLLAIVGITLAGGLLLLWVCWKMYRELRVAGHEEQHGAEALSYDAAGDEIVLTAGGSAYVRAGEGGAGSGAGTPFRATAAPGDDN